MEDSNQLHNDRRDDTIQFYFLTPQIIFGKIHKITYMEK